MPLSKRTKRLRVRRSILRTTHDHRGPGSPVAGGSRERRPDDDLGAPRGAPQANHPRGHRGPRGDRRRRLLVLRGRSSLRGSSTRTRTRGPQRTSGPPSSRRSAPADAFLGYLQLSLVGGRRRRRSPVIFYQLWAFISAGALRAGEAAHRVRSSSSRARSSSRASRSRTTSRSRSPSITSSRLLGQVRDGGDRPHAAADARVLSSTSRRDFLLAFGVVFELPLFIAFLVLASIVTPKQLLQFGRWAMLWPSRSGRS